MQVLDYAVWLQQLRNNNDTTMWGGFAKDYLDGYLSVVHPHLESITEVMALYDWSLVAAMVFGRDIDGQLSTHSKVFDAQEVDFVQRFREHRNQVGFQMVTEPRESSTATYGGLIICRHDDVWEVIGFSPSEIDQDSGVTWHHRCFQTVYPTAEIDIADPETQAGVEHLLAQVHEVPLESEVKKTMVSKTAIDELIKGGNVFQRLHDELPHLGLPPSERGSLEIVLNEMRDGTMRVLCGMPTTAHPCTFPPSFKVAAMFVCYGFTCLESCVHAESLFFQRDQPIARKRWAEMKLGLFDLLDVVEMKPKKSGGLENEHPKGPCVAWVVVEGDDPKLTYYNYLLVHPSMNSTSAIELLVDEMNDYFNENWY